MKTLTLINLALLTASSAMASSFSSGSLVLMRSGDGSVALSGVATAAFLQEYTTAGSLVQTINLPTADSGPNQTLTISGSATSEGYLHRSADGQYLVFGGYDAAPGLSGPNSAAVGTVNRVIGRVGASGVVDTTTAISSGTSGNFRSVTSVDGSSFWASSSGINVGHVASLGATTASDIRLSGGSGPNNLRVARIFGGQLYGTSASGSFFGVMALGSGLPTSGAVETVLPGFPTTSGPSPYDFYLADLNTGIAGMDVAWVADDRTTGLGGIQRWDFNGTTWSLSYTLGGGTGVGAAAVTVDLSGANPLVYALTREANNATPNKLFSFADTGAGSSINILATAPANTQWRGLDFAPSTVPEPSVLALVGLGLFGIARRMRRA